MSFADGDTVPVTIGLPFYNCVATLPQALRSIFAQTRTDWELLLVDDGSTDGSLRVARSVTDARVRVVSDGTNRGLVHRLNQIADMVRGRYLCRMDGDDVMYPRRLELQLEFLDAHPDVDVVGSSAVSIDEAGAIRGLRGTPPAVSADPVAILAHGLFIHPSITGRTAWFRAHRYDPEFPRAEDHELWCRTARASRFAVVQEPLLFYREPRRVNLGNYVASCRTERAIFRRYGPEIVGRGATLANVTRSLAKEACFRIASLTGLDGRLVALRSRKIPPTELAGASAALDAVNSTCIPGLER